MLETTCYGIIKDVLTLLSPFVIAVYVYILTSGDAKRKAKIDALYKLHESINSVRYQHAMHEIMLERQAESTEEKSSFLSDDEVLNKIIDLELTRSKLGANCLLVKSVFHSDVTRKLEGEIKALLLARSKRKPSDEISKLADNALTSVNYLVEKLT